MGKSKVFVVSADAAVGDSIKALAESADLQTETFASLQAFLDAVAPGCRGCLVLDVHIDDLIDRERQAKLATACAIIPGLLIIDRGDVPAAVRAVKAGAMDIMQKPYRDENLLDSIKKALQAAAATHG